ncbi:putative Strictosidine synthase [Quillaja saponaria]|uniref:Strictosidine synthase n=1 Tax=Quillaja saponaria TaxID=32244 RepID=A0AAD7PZM9_QUISA|nr:putative Strictosidine synthase [Quillaja saponaria]
MGKVRTPALPTVGFSNGSDGRGWTDFAFTTSQRKDCIRPFAPELEHVCGQPLGLRFDKRTGDLYIADSYLGLQVVGTTGGMATQVVTEVEGQSFTNDMDIDEDEGIIYFTDTSTIFYRSFNLQAVHGGTPEWGQDWQKPLLVGHVDTFAELPGFPDNVRRNSKGEFWVALHAKQTPFAKWMYSNSWAGKTLLKFPLSFRQLHALLVGGKAHATSVKLSDEGKILEVLEDTEGKVMRFISEVEEKGGKLWIGSVLVPFIGIYKL